MEDMLFKKKCLIKTTCFIFRISFIVFAFMFNLMFRFLNGEQSSEILKKTRTSNVIIPISFV